MPDVRSLTLDEARERARLVTVDRYDIDIDMTGLQEGSTWRATSTITFGCPSPGAATFVDCAADVVSATLNGEPVPADRVGSGRIELSGLAEHNVLVVESTQDNVTSQQGIQRCVDPSDGEVYVWTSFEPDDARMCWACFDQPDLKAPHAFTVLAPEAWTVLSNRGVDTVAPAEGGRRWTFPDTPPLSTYVVVVNAGPFHEVRSKRGGHDLGFYCRKSLAEFLDRDAEELFGLTETGLAFFADKFGRPFGQERYDQVFIPDMAGAMENWGCVTWGDVFVYRNDPTRLDRARRAEVLLHEMAHMWFGDLVTMQWWDDLWLNEAFATWAALWAMVNVTEFSDAWASFLTRDKARGYAADRAPNTHPIRQPAPDVAEGTASFDDITYLKGASVLKQLVAYVGEEAFTAGLRTYFERHAWGNTALADLMSAVGGAAGRDLDEWTAAWLDRAGSDRIELERTGEGWLLRSTAPDGAAPRPHRLDVGVYDESDGTWTRTALVPVETTGAETVVADPPAGDLVLPNDEDLTFARTRPDAGSLDVVLTRSGELPTPMARAVAVSTAWDMLAYAEVGAAQFVRCAVSAARTETEPGLAEVLLIRARFAADAWAPAAQRDTLLQGVADLASTLAAEGRLGRAALLTLAMTASTDAHVAQVREAVASDVDLGWTLQVRLAELGRPDQAEVDALLERDPDPDAWVRALQVRAALPDREAKEEVWQTVWVDKKVPVDQVLGVAPAFWRPGQADLLREYTSRYLQAVGGLSGGNLTMLAYTRSWFPTAVGDAEFLAEAETFAHAEDTNPTVRLNLLQATDTLRRMLRTRAQE